MNDRPWFEHYDPGVPHTLAPYPTRTLLDYLRDAALERPDALFAWFEGGRFSWREIDELSGRFATALMNEGVQPGDRVAVVLPNCPQMLISELGIWKTGAIAVPLNPLYTEEEIERALKHVGAKIAVALTLCYNRIKRVQPRTAVRRVIASSIKDYLPRHLALLFTLIKEKKEGHRVELGSEDVWFADLLARNQSVVPSVPIQPEDTALLLFTGGTTGVPKAAIIRHQGLVMAAMQHLAWGGSLLTPWCSVSLLIAPLFHVYGSWLLSSSICGHFPIALVPNPRDISHVLATIRRAEVAYIPAVPLLFAAILEHPSVGKQARILDSLRICSSGAAPLMMETHRRWEQVTGKRICEGYALTESCCGATSNPTLGLNKCGSVGIPLPDVEVRIVDAENGGDPLPAGQVGEILLRAPQMIRGYWGAPAEDEFMLHEGWLRTGDLGYMDKDSYLFIVDRKKDLIKSGGFQVWPREVEEVISAHPAVSQAGVVGVPDAHRGEAVKAFVVLKLGACATSADICAHCRQHLAGYKVPREVEFRTELPTTLVGKVLRRELRSKAVAAGQHS